MKNAFAALSVVALLIVAPYASANTVPSSTLVFYGPLTYDSGSGSYSGIVPMVTGAVETSEGVGDGVGGYDIYGRDGSTAWFGDANDDPVWSSVSIGSDHDAWSSFSPDTPDWYQYSLNLYYDSDTEEYRWAVRNHPGATEEHPWYDTDWWDGSEGRPARVAMGVPMSGTIEWTTGFAEETDTGVYLPGTGTAEIPGGAAGHGGGAHAWDMDWSWGSEVVPLQLPGFQVDVTSHSDIYTVTLTPIPEPMSMVMLGALGAGMFAARKARRRT